MGHVRSRTVGVSRDLGIESKRIADRGDRGGAIVHAEHVLPLVLLAPQNSHDGLIVQVVVEHGKLRDAWVDLLSEGMGYRGNRNYRGGLRACGLGRAEEMIMVILQVVPGGQRDGWLTGRRGACYRSLLSSIISAWRMSLL